MGELYETWVCENMIHKITITSSAHLKVKNMMRSGDDDENKFPSVYKRNWRKLSYFNNIINQIM